MREPIDIIFQSTTRGVLPVQDVLEPHIDDIISGKWRSLEFAGFPILSQRSKSMFPATQTVLCGAPGATKSLWLIDQCYRWHLSGIGVSVLMLEGTRQFHLMRLLAMLGQNWDVLDDKWGRENPSRLQSLYSQNSTRLDQFNERCLFTTEKLGRLKYSVILDWMRSQCDAGSKILVIDPITAVSTGNRRDQDDLNFILDAHELVKKYDDAPRVILVTHPKAGIKGMPTIDAMAGGQAFCRHTDTVLWLSAQKDKEAEIMTDFGPEKKCCNRVIHVFKGRNGPGQYDKIGVYLDGAIKFNELGRITKMGREWQA